MSEAQSEWSATTNKVLNNLHQAFVRVPVVKRVLARIEPGLDDGVKVNYEKVQTARDGKKYSVLEKI